MLTQEFTQYSNWLRASLDPGSILATAFWAIF